MKFKKWLLLSTIITFPITVLSLVIMKNSWSLKSQSFQYAYFEDNVLPFKTIVASEYNHMKNGILSLVGFKNANDNNVDENIVIEILKNSNQGDVVYKNNLESTRSLSENRNRGEK